MKIMIDIATENAAFADGNKRHEVTRILRKFVDQFENDRVKSKLYDVNGNAVGEVLVDGDEEDEKDDDA